MPYKDPEKRRAMKLFYKHRRQADRFAYAAELNGGVFCGICGSTLFLEIDHDHKTNRIRGLLCHNCNRWLGWYEKFRAEVEAWLK